MELDDLKDIWKNNRPEYRPKEEHEIALMLNGRSKSIVDKLKRSVWFELIFTLVAGVVLLGYALTLKNGALKWTSISILILFVLYCFYYIKKLSLLNRFNPGQENLKAHIEALIENLSSYLRFYRRSYTILYPVYFCLGLLFGGLERGTDEFLHSLAKPAVILYLLLVAVLFFFCSTWLTNWYLKKLYGNHLEKLKGLLTELQLA
ncbi:MAG: hypothetical protein JNM57_14465 [Cyclobacteriaceae bacterium]|nr:hypothetical protein [Cyclobacteriaceae bacterium]